MTDKDDKKFSLLNGNGNDNKGTDSKDNKVQPGTADLSEDGKPTFDSFARAYGVDKAVARGVRSMVKVASDGTVTESDFVAALKKFTGQTPK